MCRLLDQKPYGSPLDLCVVACSKGAEVYSFLWAIHTARPDLRVSTKALDISEEILKFAERGVYSLKGADDAAGTADATWRDQALSIFERLTDKEVKGMFEVEGDRATIKPGLKQGITWRAADASHPELPNAIGLQDIVIANRFLCHMEPVAAEKCLRNIARLVKPGGYLFVSGVDLSVRTKVAQDLDWNPVPELLREVHEGDVSLQNGWPMEWWGQEPFCEDLPDWRVRYASAFQIATCTDSE